MKDFTQQSLKKKLPCGSIDTQKSLCCFSPYDTPCLLVYKAYNSRGIPRNYVDLLSNLYSELRGFSRSLLALGAVSSEVSITPYSRC
jgi:hypothetical protein